jgi:hypothetical protein
MNEIDASLVIGKRIAAPIAGGMQFSGALVDEIEPAPALGFCRFHPISLLSE